MRVVERMVMDPNRCLTCGAGNIENPDGTIGPFIDLEVEVGWGDSVYICPVCVHGIALLFDYMTPDDKQDLEREIAKLEKDLHDARAHLEQKQRRLDSITEARKALREEKAEKSPKRRRKVVSQ